jgi:phosphohistidine phosphatase
MTRPREPAAPDKAMPEKVPAAPRRAASTRTRTRRTTSTPPSAPAPAPAGAGTPPAAEPATATSERARPAGLALYLVRHADAGDPMAWTGDDAERPLSKKGRRQAKRLGQHLQALDIRPDLLLTSPKVRAAETARLVGRAIGVKPSTDDRLAIDFGQTVLASLVAALPAETRSVLLVGHDPDLSDAATWLVGAPLTLRKGALALIELDDREAGAARGSLRWLLPPDAVAG